MSSSSSSISTEDSCNVKCRCGMPTRIRTSWTEENPGRRFFGCSAWKRTGGGCGFFEWYDLPIEGRARSVIQSLMKKQGELQDKISDLEKKLEIVVCRERVGLVGKSRPDNPSSYCTVL